MTRPSLADLLATPVHRGLALSPDGARALTSSNASGVFNATELTLCGKLTARTRSDSDAIYVLDYLPSGRSFLFSRDAGGDEIHHVHVCDPDGSTRDATPWEGALVNYLGLAADGESFLVAANREDRTRLDLYRIDVETLVADLVYRPEPTHVFHCADRAGAKVAMSRRPTSEDSDVFVVDLATATSTLVTAHEGDASFFPHCFSADGAHLYVGGDLDADRHALFRIDLATGDRELVLRPEGDVVDTRVSREGRYRAVVIDHEAIHRLEVHHHDGKDVPLPDLPEGQITDLRFGRDERTLAFLLSTSTTPPTPYRIDLWTGEGTWMIPPGSAGVAPAALVETEHRWFPSYDDLEVPGVLYPAPGRASGEPGPGVVWVHGGPGGQSRRSFDVLRQALAVNGYEVFAVNNRGSSGYGRHFHSLDRRGHGDKDLGDCVAAKKVLIETGRVDPDRIAIAGGSYGGYLALAALAFRPGEFACGVDIFGVSNLLRCQREIPPWWTATRDWLYDLVGHPEEDEEYLRSISPVFHAEKIDRPLIVLQGARDPRVKQAESDDIVAAVRANGVPVEYVLFGDEGHGFVKTANQLRGYQAILDFLGEHL